MPIPPRFKDELRDRLTLSDVIGKRVRLTRAGREFKGCCPFHHEKTPSFYVNDDKQFYHCFGCGAHGDVIGFVMQHDNLAFTDAIAMLAAEAGLSVPSHTREEVERAREEKSLYALMDQAARYFEQVLHDTAPGADGFSYMTGRGVGPEQMRAFRIGFAPADGQAMRKYMRHQGYTDSQMIECGILRTSTQGTEPYAFFRDRVMFPVPDKRGRIVAFGGRILPEHLRPPERSGFKPPKYINSSETVLFHKGSMLYGEPRARQAAAEGKPLIVVEGYLDVMACVSAGYSGAVAPLGTALTDDQIIVLWKMFPGAEKVPVLCFDGDEAGRRAAARACERVLPLLGPGKSVRLAFLPEGEDPDSLIRTQGAGAFGAVIEGAIPLVDFLWMHHTAGKSFAEPESRAALSRALELDAMKIGDREVQQHYRAVFRMRIGEAFFGRKNGAGGGKTGSRMDQRPAAQGIALRRPAYNAENLHVLILLAAAVNHPAILQEYEDQFAHLEIADEGLNRLRGEVLDFFHSDFGLDSEALRGHLNGIGLEAELERLLRETVYTHAGFARPHADEAAARQGWRDTLDLMQKKGIWREVRAAGRKLADDFSKENEARMLALQDMERTPKS